MVWAMGVESCVNDNIGGEVGDGSSTLLWWDLWVEGGTLNVRLYRLLYLSDNKMATVREMNLLGWGEGERHRLG